jgi:hypothetical protein
VAVARAKEEIASLEAEYQKALTRTAEMTVALQRAKGQLDQLRDRCDRARERLARLEADAVSGLRPPVGGANQVARAKEELSALEAQHQTALSRTTAMEAALEGAKTQLAQLRDGRDQIRESLARLEADLLAGKLARPGAGNKVELDDAGMREVQKKLKELDDRIRMRRELLRFGELQYAPTAKPPAVEVPRYALLIAVREYDPTELTNLRFPEDDIRGLAEVFRAAGYRRVVLMSQTEGAHRARLLPTAKNVRETLKGFLEDKTADDTVVVALAGHGIQFRGQPESYFCPMDARLGDKNTLVPFSEIFGELGGCGAGVKLLLADCCRNDPQADGAREGRKLESVTRPQQTPPGGVAALFSCSEGERAFESPMLGHGVFAHFVIEGLKGEADLNGDGQISLEELALFTKRHVLDRVKDEFGEHIRQMPVLKGELRGLAPLVTVAKPPR